MTIVRVRISRETAAQLGVPALREAMRQIGKGFARRGLLCEIVVPKDWAE